MLKTVNPMTMFTIEYLTLKKAVLFFGMKYAKQ